MMPFPCQLFADVAATGTMTPGHEEGLPQAPVDFSIDGFRFNNSMVGAGITSLILIVVVVLLWYAFGPGARRSGGSN